MFTTIVHINMKPEEFNNGQLSKTLAALKPITSNIGVGKYCTSCRRSRPTWTTT